MTTVATPAMQTLAGDWETKCGLTSATCSGIVGDLAHKRRGGYHISREDQAGGNYSVVRPDDRGGPDDASAGIDMTMSVADMKTCTARLVKAYENRSDPRRKYVNAFNGTVDGKTARRWDVYARRISAATPDHVGHVHLEIRRKYVNSPAAMRAVLSILKGESVETYLTSIGVKVAPVRAPAYPGYLLRRNDRQTRPDANVKRFQEQMRARGWTSVGPADGYFGPRLEAAVKKFQGSRGMVADGLVGPLTWPMPWTQPIGK